MILATKFFHSSSLSPTKALRNEIFSGVDFIILVTVSWGWFVILYIHRVEIKFFEWAVAYPCIFLKSCFWSVINFEGTTIQNLIFYFHQTLLEIRVFGFDMDLWERFSTQILVSKQGLTSPSSLRKFIIQLLNRHLFWTWGQWS